MNFGVESQNLNFFKPANSSHLKKIGARVTEVEEPLWGAKSVLFEFEVDEVAEPKALIPEDLFKLILKYGSFLRASKAIGTSEAYVRQNAKKLRRPSGK